MRNPSADAAIVAGQVPIWLLTLTLPDGRSLRYSTQPISVPFASSLQAGPLQYHPLLSGVSEFVEELDVYSLSGTGSFTQVRVDIAWDQSLVALHADWYHLTAADAEVAFIWDGQTWEERTVVLGFGTVQGLEMGVAGEATTITLESTPPVTSVSIGDDSRDVGADWPSPTDNGLNALTELEGRKYQNVIGAVHRVPGYKVGGAVNNKLVLAGHHFPDVTAVQPYEDGLASGGALAVQNGTLSSGDYAYIEDAVRFSAASGAWTYAPIYGGMAAADNNTAPALRGDGVLRKLLTESGLKVDWDKMWPTLVKLRGWDVGFYTDQQKTAIELIRDRLLPYLPLIETEAGDGIWFAYVDPERAPIEGKLIVGQNLLGRRGRIAISDMDEIYNEFAISYAYDPFYSSHTLAASLDGDSSTLCYLSEQMYGARVADVMECKCLRDASDAERAMARKASRHALPRRWATYLAADDLYWMRAGSVWELEDSQHGISSQRVTVRSIDRSLNPHQVVLDFVDRTPISRLA